MYLLQAAVETMAKVGEQINEMKKKYEATVKLQVYCTTALVYYIVLVLI